MIVNGEGPTPCEYLILGEAPGAGEERQGRPFVGASGKLLDRALESAGISRSDVYITNAYKSRPPNNRTPTDEELDDHYPLLIGEWEDVKPKRVLLLGAVALHVVYPKITVGQVRGTWQHMQGQPEWYMPTWHPSYALRHFGWHSKTPIYGEFIHDVRRFFNEDPNMRD